MSKNGYYSNGKWHNGSRPPPKNKTPSKDKPAKPSDPKKAGKYDKLTERLVRPRDLETLLADQSTEESIQTVQDLMKLWKRKGNRVYSEDRVAKARKALRKMYEGLVAKRGLEVVPPKEHTPPGGGGDSGTTPSDPTDTVPTDPIPTDPGDITPGTGTAPDTGGAGGFPAVPGAVDHNNFPQWNPYAGGVADFITKLNLSGAPDPTDYPHTVGQRAMLPGSMNTAIRNSTPNQAPPAPPSRPPQAMAQPMARRGPPLVSSMLQRPQGPPPGFVWDPISGQYINPQTGESRPGSSF